MNDELFWQLVAKSKQTSEGDSGAQVATLQASLQRLPESEIIEFDRLLHGHLARSYHRDLWAAAYIINGGCSDDGFDYFRAWLVAQGREVFERALGDPETLVDVAEPEVELEEFMYAPVKAYEEKTKKKFPYSSRPPSELSGDEWEETAECLQKKYPRLFEKFWNAGESAAESEGGTDMDLGAALAALGSLAGLSSESPGADSLFMQATFLAMDETPDNLAKSAEMLRQAAEQGHAGAQHLLGTCYQDGYGVPKDYVLAEKYLRLAAEQDHGDACAGLGLMYQDGLGVPQDYAVALKWYQRGVENESAVAASGLGFMYADGLGVKKSPKESLKWFRRAAQDGDEVAANSLGVAYFSGQGVKVDHAEAAKWFTQAADAGHSEAQFNLGVLHENGHGVPKDLAKASELYESAAGQGHAGAQCNLGMIYANGVGRPQDYAKAAELYRQSAEQGNLVALSNLAVLRQNGHGVPQDLAEVVRLYRQVAEAGSSAGQFNLGTMYERGLGVEKDFAEAMRWYRLAADQGMAAAQNNIGGLYETGRGVEQDYVESAKWYRLAADQGTALSQFSLGNFYRKGLGVKQDFAEAEKWYQLAAAQGLDPATQRLEEMRQAGELKSVPTKRKQGKVSSRVKKSPAPESPKEKKQELVSADTAIRRALCLRALVRRANIEAVLVASRNSGKPPVRLDVKELAQEARQINDWLREQEIWPALSEFEKNSLKRKPGTWTTLDLMQWGWRFEALAVITWALGSTSKIPRYDQQVSESVFKKLPLCKPVKKLIAAASLRSEAKIREARDIAEAWLWRARTTTVQKSPDKYPPPPGWTYEKIIKTAAQHWQKKGIFKAIKGDYPALGKPYGKLTEEEWSTCQSIATERLYGLNWLCGYAEDWDFVPTGT